MKKLMLMFACTIITGLVQAESKYTASDNAVYVQAINDLKATGLIISMNEDSHTIVVNPSVWAALDYELKERAVSIVGAHFDYQSGYSSVTVLDRYTNKKLAAFGIFGLKVY